MGPGIVEKYAVVGNSVEVVYNDGPNCRGTFIWNVRRASEQTTVKRACGAPPSLAASRPHLGASGSGSTVRVRLSAHDDAPDRAEVIATRTSHVLHSWPLFFHPRSVSTYAGIAVFATAGMHGLYAMRLQDGRLAMLAAERPADAPVISPLGVIYNDDMQRYRPHSRGFILKVIPLRAVRAALAAADGRLETRGRINALAAEDARLAVGISAFGQRCSRVLLWHAPWNFVARISSETEVTCPPASGAGGITAIALGGNRIEWATRYGQSQTVIAASVLACREWVVARMAAGRGSDELAGVAGDGGTLAFAEANRERELRGASAVSVIAFNWRRITIQDSRSVPIAISTDEGRVAVLRSDGVVTVTEADGRALRTISVGRAVAVSVRANYIATLTTRGAIEMWSIASGRRLAHVETRRDVRPELDVHYGIAVVTAGKTVFAADLRTGKVTAVAHPDAAVHAQIEAAGIFYSFNHGERGEARFIPMAEVERALGRSAA